LAQATRLVPAGPVRDEIERGQAEIKRLTEGRPDQVAELDAAAYRRQVSPLLERVSQIVRGEVDDRALDRRAANLIGAKLRGTDLRGASLRGAYLLGADLRGANMCKTDLLGADLRGADLRAALLGGSLFLTQPQVDAATGDAATTLPPLLVRPPHWSTAVTSTGLATGRRHQRQR